MKRSRWVYALLSGLVTAGVLGYLYTQVSWATVREMIARAHPPALLGFLALSLLLQGLRTARYALVLQPMGWRPPPGRLFLVVIVRGLFVDLLPARLGELVFIYLARAKLGVPLGAATAGFALTFLFDLLALVPLLVLAALWFILQAGGGHPALPLAAVGIGIAAVTALILMRPILRIIYAVLRRFSHARRSWRHLRRWVAATHRNLRCAAAAHVTGRLFGMSLLVRLTKYAALYVLLVALVHAEGYTLTELPLPKVFVGLCSAEMAASLPIAGLAGFGAYEGAWAVVFGLLVFPTALAQATSLAHHLLTQLWGYGLGVLAMLLLLIPSHRRAS